MCKSDSTECLPRISNDFHHLNLADRERLARSLGYMEAFSDACAARDGPRAQGVMREAIEWTLEYLVEALEPGSAA